jgi:lysophospholipase L1-like esterase
MSIFNIKPIRIMLNTTNYKPNNKVIFKKGCLKTVPIEVTLNDRGGVLNIPEGTTGEIKMLKPDNKEAFNPILSISDDIITFEMSEDMQSYPGLAQCELILMNGNEVFTSVTFPIEIQGSVYGDSNIQSLSEYKTILNTLIAVNAAGAVAQEAYTVASEAGTILIDVNAILAQAETDYNQFLTNSGNAITAANTAAGNANTKATLADQKATLADEKATLADQKAAAAQTATENAENKIVDVEARFNTLTSEQQQASEVLDARKGQPSLKAKMDQVDSSLAQKANKDEVSNVMTPKGNSAYTSLPTTGNTVGWYYYCPDGDGTHGAGNYVWNGTSWYFGGAGDEGYSILKNDLDNLNVKSIESYTPHNGFLSSTGTWNNVTSSYQHVVIPVVSGDKVSITAPDSQTLYYGILKSYTNVASGNTVPYSSDANYNGQKVLSPKAIVNITLPSDGAYIVLVINYNNINCKPSNLTINNYDYTVSLKKTIVDIKNTIASQLDASNIIPLNNRKQINGLISINNTWTNITKSYAFVIIPCKPGDAYTIVGNPTIATYYGALKEFTGVIEGDAVPFSSDLNWNTRKSTSVTVSGTLPNDANYILVMTLYNNSSSAPSSLIISGIDYAKTVYQNLIGDFPDNITRQMTETLTESIFHGFSEYVNWESGTFSQNIGSTSTNSASVARARMVGAVKSDRPLIIETDGLFSFLLCTYSDELVLQTKDTYKTDPRFIPKNTYFRIVIANALDNTINISAYTTSEINSHIVISNKQLANIINPSVKWCAMGDSITEGYVSYESGGTISSKVDKNLAWAYKLADKNNWDLTNIAIGGTGWIDLENSDTEGVTGAWYIARHTDFTPYNLVTVAYGVNDWKGNILLGTIDDDASVAIPNTIYGGIKATIEAIIDSNPHCKIIVVTPLNCAGYVFEYGSEATNWGLSYSFPNNGTLENVVQAITSVCNYYGIQYIDQTHYSCVNRHNLLDCLTDGVHPNAETHEILMRELSRKISFN